MEEGTILLAIISAASGLIGAGIGAWTNIRSAKLNTDAQIKQSILGSFLTLRIQAYRQLENTYTAWYNFGSPVWDTYESLGDVCNMAILIAGSKAKRTLENLIKYIRDTDEMNIDINKVESLHNTALSAMIQDLKEIELPKVV